MRRDGTVVGKNPLTYIIAGVIGSLVVLWIMKGLLRTDNADVQLARTVERAVEMAEEAHSSAEATRRASSTIRVVALMVGTAMPLLVALAVYVISQRGEASAQDVLQVLRRERLIDLNDGHPRQLLQPCARLSEQRDGEEGDRDGS